MGETRQLIKSRKWTKYRKLQTERQWIQLSHRISRGSPTDIFFSVGENKMCFFFWKGKGHGKLLGEDVANRKKLMMT